MSRPPRRRKPEGRSRSEPLDPAERQKRQERKFLEEIENRIKYFLMSEDQELLLEPMNSYKRRLVHKLAVQYKLGTESRGEEPERWVCLIRTEEAVMPKGRSRAKLWDFGAQTFPVNPGEHGVRIALKADGSVELWSESDRHRIVDERLVTSRQIRVRHGKIVTPEDPDW